MECPRCQHENPAAVKFCGECGARLDLACPACRAPNPPANKFCHECGAPMGPKPAAGLLASPESYTPRHLAERILISRSALEGERKQVTVLFADLKGSMELLADRDPEEARTLLDPVLDHMMEAVHRYEGVVNQVMGDGIMALFGAPLAYEDHAVRACYAALRMQDSVQRYAEEVFRSHGLTVRIRVGLNSGEVVVGAIGSDLRMTYTAVGRTTHLAARMEQLADPGTSLLTPATLRLAEGYVEVKARGRVPVKGLSEPVEVFELVGSGHVRSRLRAAAAHGLTRFVGRDRELDQLREARERVGAGHGEVVAVVGEPGVGKSRLYWEFTHSQRAQGWLILETGSVSYGKATAYLPVIELLKGYFQIEGRDDTRKIREKVTGKLLALDRQLEPSLPALLSLLDVPVDDTQWEQLDPPQRRQWTLDGVKRLLLRESRLQPLMVLFEDLHWIDSETQLLLDSLIESLPSARLLLLVSYRPEYRHAWDSTTCYRQLRIDPLPAEGADDLLVSLLGTDTSLEPLKRTLIERTEGNPLFLEESVRTLVEAGALIGEPGAYRVAHDARTIQVPATVQAILTARIDRLAPADKRLLQAASIIGHDVPFAVLHAIADRAEGDVRHGLARLQAADFLYETRLFPDAEYRFKHALTHEVAYSTLLQDRRRALHAAILDATERLYRDRLAEHVERLAHHAFAGEVWDKAATYLRQAGMDAFAHSAHHQAAAYFEQALVALGHLATTRNGMERAIDIRLDLRNSLVPVGEVERVLEHLRRAGALAESLNDQRRLGWVSGYMSACLWSLGDYRGSLEAGRRTQALAIELGDARLHVYADLGLAWTCHSLGTYRDGATWGLEAVGLLLDNPAQEHFGVPGLPAVVARTWVALCLAERGDFGEAMAHGEEAVGLAEKLGQPWSLVNACLGLGGVYLRRGQLDQAVWTLQRGLDASQRFNIQVWFPPLRSSLGYAYALSGRLRDGTALLAQAVEQARVTGLRFYHSLGMIWLSEAHLLADRREDAQRLADEALDLCRRQHEAGTEAWALRLMGQIAAAGAAPDLARAERHLRDALARAVDLEMRPLAGHCHYALGQLALRRQRRAEARENLSASLTLYRDTGGGPWAIRAEAALSDARLSA